MDFIGLWANRGGSRNREEARPAQAGACIGPKGREQVGTLGFFVRQDERYFLMTAEHVLAPRGQRANVGEVLTQPGHGGTRELPGPPFASVHKTGGISYSESEATPPQISSDWAIAEVHAQDIDPELVGMGPIKPPQNPKRGQRVVKIGRTSGRTFGRYRGTVKNPVIEYRHDLFVRFRALMIVESTRWWGTWPFVFPGDSGAPLVLQESNALIGMVVARNLAGAWAVPVQDLLGSSGCELVLERPRKVPEIRVLYGKSQAPRTSA